MSGGTNAPVASKHRLVLLVRMQLFGVAHAPRSMEVLTSAIANASAARYHRLVSLARRLLCGVAHVPKRMEVLISGGVNDRVANRLSFGVAGIKTKLWCSACAKKRGGVNIGNRKCSCGKVASNGVAGTKTKLLV
jgi:hypothetical protein